MKKKTVLFLCTVITVAAAFPAFCAEGIVRGGRTLVPVRGVFEELGFTVDWDAKTATATVSDPEHTISVIKGKNYFTADGKDIIPDVPQQIIDQSMYLPLRAIGDAVGAKTEWDAENKIAHITYGGIDSYVYCVSEQTDVYTDKLPEDPSQIEGVSREYYDEVMSYFKSEVFIKDIDSRSPADAVSYTAKTDYFKAKATNSHEEDFILATELAGLDYMALCDEYKHFVSSRPASAAEVKKRMYESISAFFEYSGSTEDYISLAFAFHNTRTELSGSYMIS